MERFRPGQANDVYFDSGMQGWIKTKARQEYWRVSRWYELSDLIQDGYLCYLKCRNKYALSPPDPGAQDLFTSNPSDGQRRHFMALVKTTYFNHIMTLSSEFASSAVEENISNAGLTRSDGQPVTIEDLMPAENEVMTTLLTLKNAPTEIAEAIQKLVGDGIDGGSYLRSRLRRHGNRVTRGRRALRETTGEHLARVLGSSELPEQVRAYLLPQQEDNMERLLACFSSMFLSSPFKQEVEG
jgi:hypothetical protein